MEEDIGKGIGPPVLEPFMEWNAGGVARGGKILMQAWPGEVDSDSSYLNSGFRIRRPRILRELSPRKHQ